MNLVKLEDDLKQLPEQTLIGYVQTPQNQVPTYLVLAELERRKRMKQGAMASMQQQNTTVADRMVAEAQPQQAPQAGVASLPVENIGDEAAYAAGGIVAFAEGGDPYSRALGESGWSEAYTKLPAAFKDIALSPLQFRWVRDPETGELIRAYEAEGWTPRLNQAEKNWSSRMAANDLAAIQERSAKQFGVSPGQVSPAVAAIPNEFAPPTQPTQAQEITLPDGSVVNKAAYEQAMAAQTPGTGEGQGQGQGQGIKQKRPPRQADPTPQGGIGALYTEPADLSGEFVIPEATTAELARQRYLDMVGVDPFQQRAEEKLSAMEARAKEDERVSPWMALAEAGFAIAGGESPYAATNIGKGAQKGIESLAKAKERAAAAEEKRFEMESRLAQAKRAEQIAATTQGFESETASQARQDAQKLAKLNYKAQREADIATNQFNAKKFQLEYKQRDREIDITAAKADKQIAATTNAMEKEMLRARLSSLTTQLVEINKQMKSERDAGNEDEVARLKSEYEVLAQQLSTLGKTGKLVKGSDGKLRYEQ